MRLAMLPNRDPERESRCLLLPRVALGNLGPPSCDSLHRPGLRVLLPLPMRASSSKQAPRDLKPTVEGWRLIATKDVLTLRAFAFVCQETPRIFIRPGITHAPGRGSGQEVSNWGYRVANAVGEWARLATDRLSMSPYQRHHEGEHLVAFI
jgi:hypothetical protein